MTEGKESNQFSPPFPLDKQLCGADVRRLYRYLSGLQQQEIVKVGVSLGLDLVKLSDVRQEEVCMEMIRWWLDQRDHVDSIPTLQSLLSVLKSHGFNRQARLIQEDTCRSLEKGSECELASHHPLGKKRSPPASAIELPVAKKTAIDSSIENESEYEPAPHHQLVRKRPPPASVIGLPVAKKAAFDLSVEKDSAIHGTDRVIHATLHSCHEDLMNYLNFPLIHPFLNQNGIISPTSDRVFMRHMPPENSRTNINNLIDLLSHGSRDQFCKFIELLKTTAEEAGEAHEELAEMLQEKFEHYKNSDSLQQQIDYCLPGSTPSSYHSVQYPAPPQSNNFMVQLNSSITPSPTADSEFLLQRFRETLQSSYKNTNFLKQTADFIVGKVTFINLALVKKAKLSEEEKTKNKFLKATLHGSVDDIVRKKEEIKTLSDIFNYGTEEERKLVLVEGAPGVGKTMLARKLCQDWANGEILSQYNIVLLVTLRRFQNGSIKLDDILEVYGEDFCKLSKQCGLKLGYKTLLILEGWDELQPSLRQETSMFFDFIACNKLPLASVMVTSRPTVTDVLSKYMYERHVEVLGFNSTQIDSYVKQNFKLQADKILGHLQSFPNLKALAHIPLTLSIICHVIDGEDTLPSTLTELYEIYILRAFHKHIQNAKGLSKPLNYFSDLPDEYGMVVNQLGRMALSGLEERKLVFVSKDLAADKDKDFVIPNGYDGCGLLTVFQSKAKAGQENLYQFQHLSIQEYLAAYHIHLLPVPDQLMLLKEYRDDSQFQNVWKFWAGVTKLRNNDFLDALFSTTFRSNIAQRFLVHCLYEAHDNAICGTAAIKLNYKLNLTNMSLNTTDCLCAAYVMTSAGGEWNVDLRNCNIGTEGLEIFKQHMTTQTDNDKFSINIFDLTHNHIVAEGCSNLADMLKNNVMISALILGANKLEDEGTKLLCEALAVNETVTKIHFSRCELTPASGKHIAAMLQKNERLTEIYAAMEMLQDEGVIPIAKALTVNQTLAILELHSVKITIASIMELQKALAQNRTLTCLSLERNNMGPKEAQVIAKLILSNEGLTELFLSVNPFGNDGFRLIVDALAIGSKSHIEKFACFGCRVTSEGFKCLVNLFTTATTLQRIQLGGNDVGENGAKYIGEAIAANKSKSVTKILLDGSKVSEREKRKLEEIKQSSGMSQLNISYVPNEHLLEKRDMSD